MTDVERCRAQLLGRILQMSASGSNVVTLLSTTHCGAGSSLALDAEIKRMCIPAGPDHTCPVGAQVDVALMGSLNPCVTFVAVASGPAFAAESASASFGAAVAA